MLNLTVFSGTKHSFFRQLCPAHVLIHMISDTLPPLLSLQGALAPKQSPHHTLSLRGSSAAVAIRWGEIATPSARNDKIG